MRSLIFSVFVATALVAPARADDPARPLLHPMFQDHAVLQRGQPIRVYGFADPLEHVSVRLGDDVAQGVADASGRWQATLPARAASDAALTLTATGRSRHSETIRDIRIGDVFLCSGQSNMQMEVSEVARARAEIAASANDNIRLFQIPRRNADQPQDTFAEAPTWRLASPDSVANFSAACFFMARELAPHINVPIGLIHASWGGSIIEPWISTDGFRRLGGYQEQIALLEEYPRDRNAAQTHWETSAARWWATRETGTRERWFAPDFDDSAWATMTQPGPWEASGDPELARFDGAVWFRAHVTLNAAQAAQAARLHLGLADDYDNSFVNGVRVGGFRGKTQERDYAIPSGVLHEGHNVIAVAVLDTGTGGGLISLADKKNIAFAGGASAQIEGPWRYRISAPLDVLGRGPLPPWNGGLASTYNAMIAPIGPYGLRGAVWYQGESNVDDAPAYQRLLPALMADWRRQFQNDALPFLIVQLPGFGDASAEPRESAWANLREAQRQVALNDAHASLITTIDIGDRFDIHPANKQEVGARLALAARRDLYGENIIASGPAVLSARRNGSRIDISFDQPLVANGARVAIGFQLCDAARMCRFVTGETARDHVRLEAPSGFRPAVVRFCWGDSPACNVTNSAQLPAIPFEIALPAR